MRASPTSIAVAAGDGIGPEILAATLHLLRETGAALEIREVEIGEKAYLRGEPTGIGPAAWETICHSAAFLKAPVTTPQGGGFKSLNVTVRTTLGLYANVRHCMAYHPFVETKHPGMDLVIVRENEEDLYMGLEYRQTPHTYEALKVMTHAGCERIVRYAFEYARLHQRKKVTCLTKDNILKFTDGLFHRVFEEVGHEYPLLEKEHWIVDIGAAKLADTPTAFDVVVLPNLYGDILSDVAAQIAGSVGLAGSANIGTSGAMFEAIHGSAPRRAGQNIANPSGLILAAIHMLVHIGQPEAAARLHNAWLKTLEEGIHTYDIFREGKSRHQVGTQEFAHAVAARLGQHPLYLPTVCYPSTPSRAPIHRSLDSAVSAKKTLVGIDLFVQWEASLDELLLQLSPPEACPLQLDAIYNRGVSVWPHRHPNTLCSDSWRCRFFAKESQPSLCYSQLLSLMQILTERKLDITQTHSLFLFDDRPGFTLPAGG